MRCISSTIPITSPVHFATLTHTPETPPPSALDQRKSPQLKLDLDPNIFIRFPSTPSHTFIGPFNAPSSDCSIRHNQDVATPAILPPPHRPETPTLQACLAEGSVSGVLAHYVHSCCKRDELINSRFVCFFLLSISYSLRWHDDFLVLDVTFVEGLEVAGYTGCCIYGYHCHHEGKFS